jgi:hypothetical protein
LKASAIVIASTILSIALFFLFIQVVNHIAPPNAAANEEHQNFTPLKNLFISGILTIGAYILMLNIIIKKLNNK